MAEYNKKWADLFPATIGNQNRPAAGVDNTLPYETDKFPQHIANDPVRYDKMNAVVSQSMSNDERLNEKINKTNGDLAAHNKDPKAHATGIAGNAATASKLASPRTLSLTGKAAGSTSFDGSANASINVTSVNADTASKLSTARKINITGNASGAATFDGSGDVSINVTVNESKHAAAADTLKSSAATEGSTAARPVWLSWEGDNTKQVVSPNLTYTCSTKTLTATNFKGHLAGNADTATKLATPRAISLTGNASGSANFDGSGNVSINTTVSQAANADKVDGIHAASLFYNKGIWDKDNWATIGTYQVNGNPPVSDAYGWGQVISSSANDARFQLYASDSYGGNGRLYYRTGWDGNKNSWNTILDSENYNTYAPTKTGGGASGTWGISISGNAASATTANSLKETLDRPASANVTYNDGKIRYFLATRSMSEGKPSGGDGPVIHLSWDRPLWESQITINSPSGHIQTRTQDSGTWGSWKTVLDSENYNNYAPTKTGGGASGTWGINISGNADNATKWNGIIDDHATENNTDTWIPVFVDGKMQHTDRTKMTVGNADTVDGYHASDLLRILGGNRTPVITDIFDRAGTIDMSTMSAADKATHKANINKASNVTQNLWNNSTGIHAYGGDLDIAGYHRGALKLTQSYKDFDKILVVGCNDGANEVIPRLYDVWELTYLFSHSYRFLLFNDTGDYWQLYGSVRTGTTNYSLSTDTIWNTQDQSAGIIAIYGIKY